MLFVVGVFVGIFIRNKELIQNEIKTRARSHYHNILLTRRWNAQYGGVFVEKKPGMGSNPYLENPDIHTEDGKTYTKKNPALMTREISVLANNSGMYSFHITSLKPLNPGNAPDAFETKALKSFESGALEVMTKEDINGKTYFRSMAPLFTEKPCLSCHAKQGYTGKKGEVRGGISVQFDISDVQTALSQSNRIIIILSVLTLAVLLGLLYFFIHNLMRKLNDAMEHIEKMASTDALTNLYNRRIFYERVEAEIDHAQRHNGVLSCIMVDLDHSKRVNDVHGHLVGDIVLKGLSRILTAEVRKIDSVARFGGEEFIILLPDTDIEGERNVAERIRSTLKIHPFQTDTSETFYVTASLGCSCMSPESDSTFTSETLIGLADKALYRAKEEGRDRVVCQSTSK